MRVPRSFTLPDPTQEKEWQPWAVKFVRAAGEALLFISRAINGTLTFGDGSSKGNIHGQWKTYVSNAVANTEDAVAHTLNEVPVGILVFSKDKAGDLYKGTTAWTASNIYLKSTGTSVTYLLWIQAP